MPDLIRSVELHTQPRDTYSRSLGRQITVVMVVRGDGGAVCLEVLAGWALQPFGTGFWELGPSEDRPPRDNGIHIHLDPAARPNVDRGPYMREPECSYTATGQCLHDVAGVAGQKLAAVLAQHGPDQVWPILEGWYGDRIGPPPLRPDRLDDLGDADTPAGAVAS